MYDRLAARILALTAPHGVDRVRIRRNSDGYVIVEYSGPAAEIDVQAADDHWGIAVGDRRVSAADGGIVDCGARVEAWSAFRLTGADLRRARVIA